MYDNLKKSTRVTIIIVLAERFTQMNNNDQKYKNVENVKGNLPGRFICVLKLIQV